jgi:hypothetical protein
MPLMFRLIISLNIKSGKIEEIYISKIIQKLAPKNNLAKNEISLCT